MNAVFCEQLHGSWPDWVKFRKYGLTRVYVDAREATKALIEGIKSQGFEAGMYRDPSWDGLSAVALAKTGHIDLLNVLAKPTDQCAYMFDIETHSSQYVIDCFTQWRKARPTRETAWTLEPHQGGWFSGELVTLINKDPLLTVIPQAYLGNMYPAAHDAIYQDIFLTGVHPDKIKLFYDGIRGAPVWMDGIVFTDARLPA